MTKKDIQKQITRLENEKEKADKKIASLKIELENESDKSKWIKIPGLNYEITKDVIYKNKSYDEIMELKKPGEELATLKIIATILENPNLVKTLKMDSSSTDDDFFFKQPFSQNKKIGRVARFFAYSGFANLGCGTVSSVSDSDLGVRFVRRISKKKGSKK